jgi:hypothetical protein
MERLHANVINRGGHVLPPLAPNANEVKGMSDAELAKTQVQLHPEQLKAILNLQL